MKILTEKLRMLAIALFMSAAIGITACSTGTSDGAVNVEESDAKDRHPNEHSLNEYEADEVQDTVDRVDAYEKTDEAHDRDNDGLADEPQ